MRRSWSATVSWVGILTVAIGLAIANAQGAAQPTGDHDFVSRAAMSNMAAIQLGHMATKQAQRADVKEFAQATIEDHLKAQKQLADAAAGAGIRWPTKLDDKYRQLAQRLSKLNNDQFDREYVKTMIDRDRDVEQMLAARAGSGGGQTDTLAAKVNQWAAATLPEVRAHLEEAEQVLAQIGKAE
jgi:putative membrane protein